MKRNGTGIGWKPSLAHTVCLRLVKFTPVPFFTILRRSSLLVLAADHSPDVGDLPQVLTLLDQYVTQNPGTGYVSEPRVGVASLDVRRGHPLQVRQGGLSDGVEVSQQV